MAWTGDPRTSRPAWRRLRNEVFARDDHTCRHCGRHSPTGTGLEADHITEHSRRGRDDLDNLQTLCAPCHKAKTNAESAARNTARAARRRRPAEPHPGLTSPTARG